MIPWGRVICEKKIIEEGGTLGGTMRGETHMGGKTVLEGGKLHPGGHHVEILSASNIFNSVMKE